MRSRSPGKASCSGGFGQEAGPELESRLLGAGGSEAGRGAVGLLPDNTLSSSSRVAVSRGTVTLR